MGLKAGSLIVTVKVKHLDDAGAADDMASHIRTLSDNNELLSQETYGKLHVWVY